MAPAGKAACPAFECQEDMLAMPALDDASAQLQEACAPLNARLRSVGLQILEVVTNSYDAC
jgi:hypothetical protein